ncbi:MAG: sugar phosphate isomerase/epimerase family protein [Bacilli bacterium]
MIVESKLSISTGMFYFMDFERSLRIIKASGIKNIEIAGYWKDGDWEVGQHLRNYQLNDIVKLANKYNLNIISFHDLSGAIYSINDDVITKIGKQVLHNNEIKNIVTHIPYCLENDSNKNKYKKMICDKYKKMTKNKNVLIENTSKIKNYTPILENNHEIKQFCEIVNAFFNLDISHLYENNENILEFINQFKKLIKSVHISGYDIIKGKVVFDDDQCNTLDILNYLDFEELTSITIESKFDKKNASDKYYIEICKNLKNSIINHFENNNIKNSYLYN